jgi:hypothetical protein
MPHTTYVPFLFSHLVVGPTCHSFPLLSLTTHQGPLVSSTFPSQRDRPCLLYSSRSSFAASLAPLARNRRRHLASARRAASSPHSGGGCRFISLPTRDVSPFSIAPLMEVEDVRFFQEKLSDFNRLQPRWIRPIPSLSSGYISYPRACLSLSLLLVLSCSPLLASALLACVMLLLPTTASSTTVLSISPRLYVLVPCWFLFCASASPETCPNPVQASPIPQCQAFAIARSSSFAVVH